MGIYKRRLGEGPAATTSREGQIANAAYLATRDAVEEMARLDSEVDGGDWYTWVEVTDSHVIIDVHR